MGWDGWIIPLEHVRLVVLINEESIMVDETSSLIAVFLCLIVIPCRKASQCRNNGVTGKGEIVIVVVMD